MTQPGFEPMASDTSEYQHSNHLSSQMVQYHLGGVLSLC